MLVFWHLSFTEDTDAKQHPATNPCYGNCFAHGWTKVLVWGGGAQADRNTTFAWEGMLSRSSVVSWHHTFTEGFSSPCVFKVCGEGRLLPFYEALQPNSCQSGEDRGMKTVLEVTVQLLSSMYEWHEYHTAHLWARWGLHILNQWPSCYGYGYIDHKDCWPCQADTGEPSRDISRHLSNFIRTLMPMSFEPSVSDQRAW